MHQLSNTSIARLETCHHDLQLIILTAIAMSRVDFGVAEGERAIKLQQQYFKEGKSKIDGITRKGKHNYSPSLAVDIYLWIENATSYDKESLAYVAGVIETVAQMLFDQGKISHVIRWGGNWDMDGTILLDQSFDDRPHFELIKPQ